MSSARNVGETAFLGEPGRPVVEIRVSSSLRGEQTWVGALRGMLCTALRHMC